MGDIGIDIGVGGHHIGSDGITEGAYGYFSTPACDKGSNGEYLKDKCRAVTGVWEAGEMALFISSLAGRYEDALASINDVIEGRIYFIAETPDGQLVAERPGSYNSVTEEYYLTPDPNDRSYAPPEGLVRDDIAGLLAKDLQDVTVRFFIKIDEPVRVDVSGEAGSQDGTESSLEGQEQTVGDTAESAPRPESGVDAEKEDGDSEGLGVQEQGENLGDGTESSLEGQEQTVGDTAESAPRPESGVDAEKEDGDSEGLGVQEQGENLGDGTESSLEGQEQTVGDTAESA
ncbi:hypothetical protein, partial [Anaplasma platys]|uniref:hypothetical protein n=1 Tax=Anaplasma platys TaxID=949 RepID=UPI00145F800F